jgi:pyruvate kinase
MVNKAKIIATIGPVCMSSNVIKQMARSGMNIARINTAHGDFEQYDEILRLTRNIKNMPVMIDIKGPEIRVRLDEELIVKRGKEYEFFYKDKKPCFSYDFSREIKAGEHVFFDNGQIKSKVKKKGNKSFTLVFSKNSILMPNKGVNIPGKKLNIPSLSKKDVKAVKYSVKKGIEFIALSFTRNKEDVRNLKALIKNSKIKIVSKIENMEGIKNIDEIISASDGIMIARGDLGVEIPQERIPGVQKKIIKKCKEKGKISIVATQMLESMTEKPTPTRAEVSDVANAILDGANAVMLSGETASGKYPVKAVRVMRKIVREAEKNLYF